MRAIAGVIDTALQAAAKGGLEQVKERLLGRGGALESLPSTSKVPRQGPCAPPLPGGKMDPPARSAGRPL